MDQTRRGDLAFDANRLLRHESGRESTEPVDFAFLRTQTFGDDDLQRELLSLFRDQARRVLPTLAELPPDRQAETAHLLNGSARGIGAWPAAAAAAAFETATPPARGPALDRLTASFEAALSAIAAYLAEPSPAQPSPAEQSPTQQSPAQHSPGGSGLAEPSGTARE